MYKEVADKYYKVKYIDLSNLLENEDKEIIKKLGAKVDLEKKMTLNDYEILNQQITFFKEYYEMECPELVEGSESVEAKGVTVKEYKELLDKWLKIEVDYIV